MSRAIQLFPYEVSTALELRLSDFDDPLAGRPVDVRALGASGNDDEDEPSTRVDGYDAFSSGDTWRKLTFRMTARLPIDELDRILPSTSSLETDTVMVVLMTCQATKFRHGVRLKRNKDGSWSGLAGIQRDDVKGTVSLRAQLLRSTGIPSSEELPFATKAGAVIAVGDTMTMYVDLEPGGAGLLHSTVPISWEDFTNSDHVWRREHPDDVFHLEPFGHEPHLYLNSRYTQLREIMDSDAKRGPEAVLRDMSAAMIAQPVLLQLATVAIAALEIDEDSGSVDVPSGWRGTVIGSVLPLLYPEVVSEEERTVRAAREIRESDGAASMLSRLGSVVQEMIASYKTVESAVRTFESTRDGEEGSDG
jgi:hypothetical protein